MLKLYTAPGACSTACHIALQESGVPFETKVISFEDGYLESKEYARINPKGYVPFLEIDSTKNLSEGTAILQYIADQAPDLNLIPNKGFEKYKAQEWLNYIATEIHKPMGRLFSVEDTFSEPVARTELVNSVTAHLKDQFNYVNTQLEGKNFIFGSQYSVVDSYLFTVMSWTNHLKIDLSSYKSIVGFQNRVYERPATQRAFKAEGLLK